MVFKKFIEIGRIVYMPASGSIAAIVDVVDNRHVIVDGPAFKRQKINMNLLQLTKFKISFLHGARTKNVCKAWEAEDVESQWSGSHWAKKLAMKATRAGLNDFQRFKVMKLKQAKRQIVNSQLAKSK